MSRPTILRLALASALVLGASGASAQPDAAKEAGQRFSKGLELHREADYQGALVEFRRAYELSPNPTVLYNIGQECQNVADYACALSSFERYLAEAKNVGSARRVEVDRDLRKLRSRVGNVDIAVNVEGAEITVDDAVVGKSPLAKPVLVNVGRHRVQAAKDGQGTAARSVEIASGESKKLSLELGDTAPQPAPSSAPSAAPAPTIAPAPAPDASGAPAPSGPDSAGSKPGIPWAGWAVTGALAGGAAVLGYLALATSSDLDEKRHAPGATRKSLDDLGSKTRTYALVSDVLTGAAVVSGVVSIVLTVRASSASDKAASARVVRVGVTPGGATVGGTF